MALVLTIDMGTTNIKVGVVNEAGEILQMRSVALETISDEIGAAEHDPEKIKNILLGLCQQVLTAEFRNEINFIISSTYHFGLMMLDGQRKPLTNISLLTDTRSQKTFSNFLSVYENDVVYKKTGCPFLSQYTLPRLFYFSKEKSELFRQAKFFHDSKSFLFEWLTGEWVTDMSTAASTQFFNTETYKWDERLLSRIHLNSEQFPKVLDGTKFMAPLTNELSQALGLKKNVQVILGVYDGAALVIGMGGLETNVGTINLGTTAMLRIPGKEMILDKNENKRIQSYVMQKTLFLNGGALNNAVLPLNWMQNNLFEANLQDDNFKKISEEPPLVCLPYLTGERDSKIGPYASGVFFGIRKNHSRIDFVRSVLEGVVYSMRYIYDALQENNMQIKDIRMGGGGINIKGWPQLFADMLAVPVKIPLGNEMALVGNAMIAFVKGEVFKDLEEAAQKMIKEIKHIYPDSKSVDIHYKRYQFFKKLRETIGPLFKEHSKL
ncbi:MAG: hypothetical protein JST17_04755 [Bacteroidetes bacterium]|nr:hypothetical protein [Bacteroidota bacterium]MBS1929720.1 hypothetical protein [Bacteroidota bacterium]